MRSIIDRALTAARQLWAREPARLITITVAAIVFAAAKLGIVIDPANVGEAVAAILPVLLGGELIRSQVTPAAEPDPHAAGPVAEPDVEDDGSGDPDQLPEVPVTHSDELTLTGDRGEGRTARRLKQPDIPSGLYGTSVTGLSAAHRAKVRAAIKQALELSLAHSAGMAYTQGYRRWQGITGKLYASQGKYPRYSDCSSWATWALYQGLRLYGVRDLVNGQGWRAGYTGTMVFRGREVSDHANIQLGDLAIYGTSRSNTKHVAVCVGGGYVLSHGGPGVRKLSINYRPDLVAVKRYI